LQIDVTLDPSVGDRDESPNSDPLELALMEQFKNHVVYQDFREVSCWHHSGSSEWIAQIPDEAHDWLIQWFDKEDVPPISVTLYFYQWTEEKDMDYEIIEHTGYVTDDN